jgi:transposase
MTAIGIDTHKATLAACAIDELGRAIGEETFANDPAGHLAFIAWARLVAPEATIGVEGSASFGAPLARAVQGAGLCVREVPPHLSRFERGRTRRPGKSDPGDALAIARVTAREPNLPPIRVPDRTSEIRLLLGPLDTPGELRYGAAWHTRGHRRRLRRC